MKFADWEKVKELLGETLALDAAARQNFLDDRTVSSEIKNEVESLLSIEAEAEDFMSVTASGFVEDLIPDDKSEKNTLIGQKTGVYQIIEEIGGGGMGAVYLAVRTDGKFDQKVAVKMLRREFNTTVVRRSFEREKEILSKLAHPNIARLLDAGTTADGVPFLVMEYIEGVAVDKFCETKNLDLNARLKLFNKICEAVGFAHRNLIVHRDLKTSNILVTQNGIPKLLDFGISKLLDETAENTKTLFGAMTPQYASPEQIKGESLTTATDIYSLGVVLYKILTGTFPYNFADKTNGKLLAEITDSEPLKPSTAQNSKHKNPRSENRNLKSLKGDVDNIILKSLSKEPARRYATVEQFAADIWNYIDGLPVAARPATFAYRLSKFYGRNKIPVIAAALIFSSLVAGIIVSVRQTKIAREQAAIAVESKLVAERETDKAKTEQERAEKISQFMFKVIAYANPAWYTEGAKYKGNARVIDVLDEMSDKIDVEFAGQADIQAELHHKFAEVYNFARQREDNAAKTEKYLQTQKFHALRALELRREFYGEWHELVAKDLMYAVGFLGQTDGERAGILNEAIGMMRETNPNNLNLPYMLEGYSSRLMMPGTPQTHEAYRQAVTPPTDENKYQIAERYLREAMPIFRLHYKLDNIAIFANECRLAYALAMQEKWTDFDAHYAVCKQGAETLKGGDLEERMKSETAVVEKALAEKRGIYK